MHAAHLTEQNWQDFKNSLSPEDQARFPTLQQLQTHAQGKPLDGSDAQQANANELREEYPRDTPIEDCAFKTMTAVVDLILLALSAWALRGKIVGAGIRAAARTAEAQLTDYEQLLAIIADTTRTRKDAALAALRILKLIWNGGLVGAIAKAIMGSLTWLDMALYGVMFGAEFAAVLGTEGVAIVALLAQALVKITDLGMSIDAAVIACNLVSHPPAPANGIFQVKLRFYGRTLAGYWPDVNPFAPGPNGSLPIVYPKMNAPSTQPDVLVMNSGKPGSLRDGYDVTIQSTLPALLGYNMFALNPPNRQIYFNTRNFASSFHIRHPDPLFAGGEILSGDEIQFLLKVSGGPDLILCEVPHGNSTLDYRNDPTKRWTIEILPPTNA